MEAGSIGKCTQSEMVWTGMNPVIYPKENFFHKLQVAINHYWTINNTTRLSSSLYWFEEWVEVQVHGSIDRSPAVEEITGGQARLGHDWDKTIAYNDTSSSGSKGVLKIVIIVNQQSVYYQDRCE